MQPESAARGHWDDCQGLVVPSEKGRMQCAVQLFERSGGNLIQSIPRDVSVIIPNGLQLNCCGNYWNSLWVWCQTECVCFPQQYKGRAFQQWVHQKRMLSFWDKQEKTRHHLEEIRETRSVCWCTAQPQTIQSKAVSLADGTEDHYTQEG